MALFSRYLAFLILLSVAAGGCIPTTINIFPDYARPLKEITLEGTGRDKILLVPIRGTIETRSREGLLSIRPSLVQEVVSHLNQAALDPQVKGVVLLIDSPGGATTASDILYHEIMRYKEKSGARVVASFLGMAASGGYYVALGSDGIVAHPTTVTGSVGTIFLQPKIGGLMDKVGVEVLTFKSGEFKDMGSLFRDATEEEKENFQQIIESINRRFLDLVRSRRNLNEQTMDIISRAGIYTASRALELGLVDEIGYVRDAVDMAMELSGIPEDSQVIVYRRTDNPNDNVYNPMTSHSAARGPDGTFNLPGLLSLPESGFYYLWAPEYQ